MSTIHDITTRLGDAIDPLAGLFFLGALAFLWATWKVLSDDLDLGTKPEDNAASPDVTALPTPPVAPASSRSPRRPRRAA